MNVIGLTTITMSAREAAQLAEGLAKASLAAIEAYNAKKIADRPAATLAVGDWAYNDINKHNAKVVSVEWDKNIQRWRYAVPGLSGPDLYAARESAPYATYAKTGTGAYKLVNETVLVNVIVQKGDTQWKVREARSMEDAENAIAMASVSGSVGHMDILDETRCGGGITVLADVVRLNDDGSERQPS